MQNPRQIEQFHRWNASSVLARIPLLGVPITSQAQQPKVVGEESCYGSRYLFVSRQARDDDRKVGRNQAQQYAEENAKDELNDIGVIHRELRCELNTLIRQVEVTISDLRIVVKSLRVIIMRLAQPNATEKKSPFTRPLNIACS